MPEVLRGFSLDAEGPAYRTLLKKVKDQIDLVNPHTSFPSSSLASGPCVGTSCDTKARQKVAIQEAKWRNRGMESSIWRRGHRTETESAATAGEEPIRRQATQATAG